MTTTHDIPIDGRDAVASGATYLGIEFGSTRIKAALVDASGVVLASGAHAWENEYRDDNWTYSQDAIWNGLQDCFAQLSRDVLERWGTPLTQIGGIGISAMMHGYLAFAGDALLTPFRTWRNTYTTEASRVLTDTFGQNVPLRWTVSHILHAALQGEAHVPRVDFVTTLAGYVHWRLSGRKVLGVGDASGVFPIDSDALDYDVQKLRSFDGLDAVAHVPWSIADILPQVLPAGQAAGRLTEEGARLLDPAGNLRAGALMAPPEGDAGTGMVATNSVRPRTGNVSAGTSAFAMVVLEEQMQGVREEIDPVTTPAGDPVAMIHTNNCTGDLDAWLRVFNQVAALIGSAVDTDDMYRLLFEEGMRGQADGAGLLSYNYLSGEHQTGVASGRPVFVRAQSSEFTLANFMRVQLYSAFGALAAGMDVLLNEERVELDSLFAHGGIFRTQGAAQQVLADALHTPVSVGESAGEGGAWGMALLTAFAAAEQASGDAGLADYLDERIFGHAELVTLEPDEQGARGYAAWLEQYRAGLPVERLAGEMLG